MFHRLIALCTIFLVLFVACSSTDSATNPRPEPEPTPDISPTFPELEPKVWNELDGGGNSVCANGSDYRFFAHEGTLNKLVIDFQGGGACWNGEGCASPYSKPRPELGFGLYLDRLVVNQEDAAGIYERNNPENPLKDWYHVFIPYCTGDLHIGDTTQTYTNPFTDEVYSVEHRGAVNTRAVLEWTFENFSAPESIFVTGCSAGSYGAAYWTDAVRKNYPDAAIYQLGDCGAGIISGDLSEQLAQSWNAGKTLPNTLFDENAVANAYVDTLGGSDKLKMAQYNTAFDGTQIFFYAYGEGKLPISLDTGKEWADKLTDSLEYIETNTSDFYAFTSSYDDNNDLTDGTQHCAIVHDDFYTVEQNGVKFRDWLDDYVNGREVRSVKTNLLVP